MRQIHGRLARRQRPTTPRGLSHESRSRSASGSDASDGQSGPLKTTGSIARAASEFQQAPHHRNTKAATLSLIAAHGSESGHHLTKEKVQAACAAWKDLKPNTRHDYGKRLREFLVWMEDNRRAPKGIRYAVPKFPCPAHRTTKATDEEIRQLLAHATPGLRFFLLLCIDLGIRHSTASRMTLSNYDPKLKCLHFTTKNNTHQSLPITERIAEILERLQGQDSNAPIIKLLEAGNGWARRMGTTPMLYKQWYTLKRFLGIREELTIHDLRRTLAEDVWLSTHDLRLAQTQLGHKNISTTARYLANKINLEQLRPVLDSVGALRATRGREQKGGQEQDAAKRPSQRAFDPGQAELRNQRLAAMKGQQP